MATIREMFVAGLMAAGVSSAAVLGASLPAWADDITRDESGGAGDDGEDGDNGGAGTPGTYVGNIEGVLTGLPGGNGGNGVNGTRGKTGEDGDHVQLTTSAPTDGSIVISANGGAGGDGGKGGNGGNGGTGGGAHEGVVNDDNIRGIPAVAGNGGDGGDAGAGGAGGHGGAGGSIQLVIDNGVTGDVVLSSAGGPGGEGGAGGRGGNGGHGGTAAVYEAVGTIGAGGNGGDGMEGGHFGTGGGSIILGSGSAVGGGYGAAGSALPQHFSGADGADGAGGSITVVLSASVGGNITADAGTGTVSVTLNTGASVGGTISANEAAQSALRFAMTVNSRAEYKAAKAYLGNQANALSGSITINGQTFTWTGFDQLVQALVLAGLRSSAGSERGLPVYLSCSPRAVTAFYKDGGIELVASRTSERGAFRIGTVLGQTFVSQNHAGWTVRFDEAAASVRFDVLDRSGVEVAHCRG